jgi:DNA repair exonuclease SbcCD ATPase subunit
MSEYLETVRQELGAGRVTAQALVLLFREAEEAEQRHDLQALEQTLELAKQTAQAADEALAEEAERLIALCEELLQRTRAHAGAPAAAEAALCPGCGRPIDASAVRCRACGTLLV